MRHLHFRSLAGVSALALATVFPTQAAAQDEASADSATQGSGGGNSIVVVGLRREGELQDSPAAITAFNAETIDNAGITKPIDFINLTPNVNLVETQNAGNAFIIIRGITQARNSEPSVAIVVDGVQQVNPAQFNQDLFDIEQIEVLKGPQGGLYGRNAIGGAIIVNTKKPSDEFEGRVRLGVDNGFGYFIRGGLSGPIAEGAAFRIAGSFYDTEGFIPNPYLGEDADPYRDLALRARLVLDLGSDVELDLRASMDRLQTQALYFNIVSDVNDTSLPVRVNNPGQNDRNIYNLSGKLTWEGEGVTVTSITSYDWLDEILTGDAFDFLPIDEAFCALPSDPCFSGSNDLNQSQFLDVQAFSQELRFESPDDDPLFWMFGGYLISTDRYISTGNMFDFGTGLFPVYREPSTNPLNPQYTFLADTQDNFAWSVFGNLGYQFTDFFRLDASLRYDHDKRENTTETPDEWLGFINFIADLFGAPLSAFGDVRTESFDDWQPKVTATFTPSDDLTLYGGYSRGFRSGGFNQTGVGVVALNTGLVGVDDIFKAETADTFEVGFKSQFLDRMVTLNGAAYTTESRNSYFFVFLPANSTQNLGNIPKTRISGLELELNVRPTQDLQFNLAWGLTDSEIKEFPDPVVIGNEAPLISRSTLNAGVQYTPELGGDLEGLLRVDYRRTGRTWWEPYNTTVRDPIHLVDARIGVKSKQGW
ncbi:MAG TPA: TonB-dependent receptor, partial [Sphingomonadaceae bacterium]|nr:TonB-dependent receptor [Sphingomonadaceae bacterium]